MPKQFTFTLPTTNVDGTPIAADEIAKVQLGLGQADGVYPTVVDDVDFAAQTSAGVVTVPYSIVGVLAYGTWFAAARVVTKDGVNSDWSNSASFTLAPPVPNAPANFTAA